MDPKFKEQFEVAHPTPRFAKVMDCVGQELLATPERLTRVSVVGQDCRAEMRECLMGQGN